MTAGALSSGASVMTESSVRWPGAGSLALKAAPRPSGARLGLLVQNALRLAQRLFASGLVAGVVGLAGQLHRVQDRLRLGRAQIAGLLLCACDGARRRLAMHGRKRRFGRRLPLSGGGVQELFDGDVGLIDPIRAGTRMS